ncbi:MAG TPA: chemotaxis protein CheW, partial [Plasticicumulans sp.]|nr:chemotaxis protein CheW [Plasticicumulans sp.]
MPDRELRCLLIGFAGGRLLLPGSMVVEVLPHATPLRVAEVPRWVLGSLLWRARTVPLLAIEPLVTGQPAAPGPRSRIVVLTTPSERVQH